MTTDMDADVVNSLQTPHKHQELVLKPSYSAGEFDSHAVDCPFLFYHNDRYHMTYVGWDGFGYQTGLAVSDDLVHWEKQGILLGRGGPGTVTEYNAALTSILRDNELFGPGTLKQVDGRYVGTYHAYPKPGYESGPAVIGLCYSDDLRHWEVSDPVLVPDAECAWEAGGLYKSWLMEDQGYYYLFYNAKTVPVKGQGWVEQTGAAVSEDLQHWTRCEGNPLLRLGAKGSFDDRFVSDPVVLRHEGLWCLFYFGLSSDGHARDSAAVSEDLLHWEKTNQVLIDVGPPGSVDSRYAHKPGIITKDNRLYHFYCAVSPAENRRLGDIEHSEVRGLSVAWS